VEKVIIQNSIEFSAHKKRDRSWQTIAAVQGFQQLALNALTIRPHSSYAPARADTHVTGI
jgi:hypothetical protein